jgi:hypothetical protein
MQFPEQFDSGFSYVLPDMKNIFISKKELVLTTEIADDKTTFDAYIMECANTIYDCKTAKFYPVDLSEDKTGRYLRCKDELGIYRQMVKPWLGQ